MSNLDEEPETSTQFKHETNLAAFQEELKDSSFARKSRLSNSDESSKTTKGKLVRC